MSKSPNNFVLAKYTIEKIYPTLQNKLIVGGVDYSPSLRALAVSAARGAEPVNGHAQALTGHHMSLLRVGKSLSEITGNPGYEFTRVSDMPYFGRKCVVYATLDRKHMTNPDKETSDLMKMFFKESYRCSSMEWEPLYETVKGYFELLNLGLKLENFYDHKRGTFFPVKGTKYLRDIAKEFDKDESTAGFRLLSDFDKAGLIA